MVVESFNKDRKKAETLVSSKNFNSLIIFLILLDSVILGLLTISSVRMTIGSELFFIDRLIVAIFICEMLIKLYAYGGGFFKKGWNVLDFSVVLMSILPATSYFVILRSFRILRLLRYIDKELKISQFLNVLISLIPIFMSGFFISVAFLYVFSVLAVGTYGSVFIEFATLHDAIFALLEVFTVRDNAVGLMEAVNMQFDSGFIFFLSFYLVSYLMILTVVVASIKEVCCPNGASEK